MNKFSLILVLFFILVTNYNYAQNQVSGTVLDNNGSPLVGVTILEKGTKNGVATDFDGIYTIDATSFPITLIFSYVGFSKIEKIITEASTGNNVVMNDSGVDLDEVVITGNRLIPRTILDSPVPIDNINVADLILSGRNNIEQMLNFKIPSFNSGNVAVSDGTAHFDPVDLRGVGPSRTLVLVNGKRKNLSSQVYRNNTPSKGEVGVDLKSIPVATIERIEILRDGASAQYGSDAVAGVINMILKKNVEYTTVSVKTGVTSNGGYSMDTDPSF